MRLRDTQRGIGQDALAGVAYPAPIKPTALISTSSAGIASALLSSVLKSERAVQVNVEIMRAFVRLHGFIAHNQELANRLDALESKYDSQFRIVFDAIRQLVSPPVPAPKRRIGFVSGD